MYLHKKHLNIPRTAIETYSGVQEINYFKEGQNASERKSKNNKETERKEMKSRTPLRAARRAEPSNQ